MNHKAEFQLYFITDICQMDESTAGGQAPERWEMIDLSALGNKSCEKSLQNIKNYSEPHFSDQWFSDLDF